MTHDRILQENKFLERGISALKGDPVTTHLGSTGRSPCYKMLGQKEKRERSLWATGTGRGLAFAQRWLSRSGVSQRPPSSAATRCCCWSVARGQYTLRSSTGDYR